jgi:hypothetical protein
VPLTGFPAFVTAFYRALSGRVVSPTLASVEKAVCNRSILVGAV